MKGQSTAEKRQGDDLEKEIGDIEGGDATTNAEYRKLLADLFAVEERTDLLRYLYNLNFNILKEWQ